MILIIAQALLPILFVVTLGYVAAYADVIPGSAAKPFSKFVVDFALPLSLFLAAAKANPSDLANWRYISAIAAGLLGSFAIAFLLGWLLFKHDRRNSGIEALACSFPNLAYCGPPVMGAVVGPNGILAIVVGNLFLTIFLLPLCLILLSSSGDKADGQQSKLVILGASIFSAVKQPLVWLPVLGVVCALSGLRVPDLLASTTTEIGSAAGGVALFTLGLMLAGLPLRFDVETLANVAVKNLVQPVLLLGAAFLLGLHGPLGKEVFLIGVLPSATLVPALAHTTKAYEDEAPLTVMASTLFSIITISVGIGIAEMLP